jgi:hypothetical protein
MKFLWFASEEAMTEFRRLKLKIGEAEFEADVPENEVQPMYHQFLSMLERRGQAAVTPPTNGPDPHQKPEATVADGSSVHGLGAACDDTLLPHIFDLRQDGAVTLKVLPPAGPDTNADAMLLLLYGYRRLKNENYVLATQLFRAAARSGITLRRPDNEYMRNSRFVIRGGQRKGSHYSLSSRGLAMAKEITARIFA